jgi:5,5'-dehydrodivanillate O-demethylase
MPNLRHDLVRPRDGQGPWHNVFRWKVPIDDEHHTSFTVELVPVTGEAAERYREARAAYFAKGGKVTDDEVVDAILDGKLRLDDVQRERWDLDMIRVQDDVTQIGQGAIRDRSQERLGRADAHLLLLRAQWERELRALAEGRPLKQWHLPEDLVCSTGPMQDRDVVGMVVEKG